MYRGDTSEKWAFDLLPVRVDPKVNQPAGRSVRPQAEDLGVDGPCDNCVGLFILIIGRPPVWELTLVSDTSPNVFWCAILGDAGRVRDHGQSWVSHNLRFQPRSVPPPGSPPLDRWALSIDATWIQPRRTFCCPLGFQLRDLGCSNLRVFPLGE